MSKFGAGKALATSICETARTMCYQGRQPGSVAHLGACGSWGRHPQNIERDLHNFSRRYLGIGIEKYHVPVRCDIDGSETVVDIPMYPVHEWLAALDEFGGTLLHDACFGPSGPGGLAEFWHHVSGLDWCQSHPASRRPDLLPHTVPACLFGDDVRVFRNEKMTVWAHSFMLSRSTTVKSRFIIAVLPHWCLLPGRTCEDVHRAGGPCTVLWVSACTIPRIVDIALRCERRNSVKWDCSARGHAEGRSVDLHICSGLASKLAISGHGRGRANE